MGGDGGVKAPTRDMIRTKGWGFVNPRSTGMGTQANMMKQVSEDYVSDSVRRQIRMSRCRITDAALEAPVVACRLGNLYNKTAVIECLLEKNMPADYSHIRSLKDVKPCKVDFWEGEPGSVTVGSTSVAERRALLCPVSKTDLSSGGSKSVFIWTTGVIIAAKVLDQVKSQKGVCLVTGEKYDADKDVIPMAPDQEELEKLRAKLPPPPAKKRKAVAAQGEAEAVVVGFNGAKLSMSAKVQKTYKETAGAAEAEKKYQDAKQNPDSIYTKLFNPRSGPQDLRDAFGTPTATGRK